MYVFIPVVKYSRLISISVLLLVVVTVNRCAHPVMPTGGPKDESHPQLVEAEPPNYSTNFDEERFVITFDEFINVDNPRKEIFISPPVQNFPDVRTRGKSVIVTFEEPLQENSTYTFFFGNAIVDITEKNPNSNFEYVFSTGDEIDSLSVAGRVINAFDKEPAKDVLVMLYLDNNDTIPLDSLPLYVRPLSATRTTENGLFQLNNLKSRSYKIFALLDNNANYIYDLPNESIAFLDSLVQPEYMFRADTTGYDSVTGKPQIVFKPVSQPENFYELHLFSEVDSTQRLTAAKTMGQGRFMISYRFPPEEDSLIILEPDTTLAGWFLEEPDRNGDTLNYWLKGFDPDTLVLEVREKYMDPDTVRLVFRTGLETKRERKMEEEGPAMKISLEGKSSSAEYFKPVVIDFSRPVESFDTSRMILSDKEDTLDFDISFRDVLKRRAFLEHPWKQDASYKLFIPDSTFIGINGSSHDTAVISFKTLNKADYGKLEVSVSSEEGHQYLLLFRDEKGSLLEEIIMTEDTLLSFPLIKPGNYKFKAILDRNRNGQWDTGNYKMDLQPEEVFFYPAALNIRANWEVKEIWELP